MGPIELLCSHLLQHSEDEYDPVNRPKLIPPLLVKGGVPPHFFSTTDLWEVFEGIAAEDPSFDGSLIRVYIDGKSSPVHEERLADCSPARGENLLQWLQSTLREERFGIIINGAERWMMRPSAEVVRFFQPLANQWGIPETSFELTLFIGNYGYTPFGVHVDDPFTYVVHFHSGPAAKTMSLMPPETFHEINGPRKRSFETKMIASRSQNYLIEAGDLFLLPPHYFHVGSTSEFSVGLAVAISRYPHAVMRKEAVRQAITMPNFNEQVETLLSKSGKSGGPQFIDWIADTERHHALRERSKRGLRYSPARRQPTLSTESVFSCSLTWPLIVNCGSGLIDIHIRGFKITFRHHPSIESLLDDIATCVRLSVPQVVAKYEESLTQDTVLHILRELEACGGLDVDSVVQT